jgi:hypothetical protein
MRAHRGAAATAGVFLLSTFALSCNDDSSPALLEPADDAGAPALQVVTTWHVATWGSDGNPGTSANPFRSVQKAVNAARPGDTILVHGGTYSGVVTIDGRSNPAAAPIVIRAAGDGLPVLTANFPRLSCGGSSPTSDRTVQIVRGSDYWTFDGLHVVNGIWIAGENAGSISDADVRNRNLPGRNSYDPAAARNALPGLGVDAADGIRILNTRVTRRGIHATAARFGEIRNSWIWDIDCGVGAAIWLNTFSDLWTIAGNHVHHVDASDKHFMSEGIRLGRASSYAAITGNTVEDLGGLGRGIATDVNASWNTIRGNRARRTEIGFSQQAGGWGNKWQANVSESNRNFGFAVYTKSAQPSRPDDSTPAHLDVSCNQSFNERLDLRIGGVRDSRFQSNRFATVKLSDALGSYWGAEGNTWNGSSKPPSTNPSIVTTGC